mmetsp:Transcript_16048/g.17955  ORF Transcript_16048/g.17955 Transcript_16048/m.17955 type:complete len:502 (-) Transcript_16048:65-1570(-)
MGNLSCGGFCVNGTVDDKNERIISGGTQDLVMHASDFVKIRSDPVTNTYVIGDMIGTGGYGQVRKVKHSVTGIERAMKMISKSMINRADKEMFNNEVSILKSLDHPNIIKIYEVYEDPNFYYLITELCTGGELFDKIISMSHFDEKAAAQTLKQVLSAIVYCHQKNIVHRDLKPENLLLESKAAHAQIKVIDFGTSSLFQGEEKLTDKFGTAYYVAPEVLKGAYDEKCDLWSTGVILYILLSGCPPFNGRDDKEILGKVASGKFSFKEKIWNNISEEAKDIIRKLLTYDPEERISASEALHHPWIEKYVHAEAMPDINSVVVPQLKAFRNNAVLQKATLTYIASQLVSVGETENLKKTFQQLDADQNGVLTLDEVTKGYLEMYGNGITVEEIKTMFEDVDTDKSGTIDYTEFIAAAIHRNDVLNIEVLKKAFRVFDEDQSGNISADELKNVFGSNKNFGDNFWQDLINEVDQNGDGEISFDEFKDMMLKGIEKHQLGDVLS